KLCRTLRSWPHARFGTACRVHSAFYCLEYSAGIRIVPRQVEQIQRDEPLARFIFSRRHLSTTKKVVKAPAFIPNPDDLQTSVFRIYELGERQIRDIGEGVGRTQSPPQS